MADTTGLYSGFYKMLATHLFYGQSTYTTYPIAYLLKTPDTVGTNDTVGVAFISNNTMCGTSQGHDFTASAYVTTEANSDGVTATAVYTITNNATDDLIIEWLKLKGRGYHPTSTSSQYAYYGRIDLPEAVTIPANGGVAKITATVSFVYPETYA